MRTVRSVLPANLIWSRRYRRADAVVRAAPLVAPPCEMTMAGCGRQYWTWPSLRLLAGGRVDPVVRVEGGLLRGRETGGVFAFLGVPYAAAPIGANRASGMAFGPVLDGQLLTAEPTEVIAAGAGRDIPLLVGSTLEEHRLFLVPTGNADATTAEALSAAVVRAGWDRRIVNTYAANRAGVSPGDVWAAICTDAYFRLPAVRLAEAHHHAGGASYLYEFAWRSPADRLGACHALELPFVFDTIAHPAAQPLLGTHPPQSLARRVRTDWIHFARHGHPDWPDYNPTTRPVMTFDHPPASSSTTAAATNGPSGTASSNSRRPPQSLACRYQ
jgi:carboxylesterase type B